MGTAGNSARNLTHILQLFKAGMKIPVPAMQRLIAGDASVDRMLIEVLRSRAVDDDAWAPLWALVVLGERRCVRALPDILACLDRGHEILRDGVEFALLRLGTRVEEAVIQYLALHPDSAARLHLMAVLAHFRTSAGVDYLIDQFRPESREFVPIAWLLAEGGHPRGLAALEAAVLEFPAEPGLAEPLEAIRRGEDLRNPLLGDWRTPWTWKEEKNPAEAEAGGEDPPAAPPAPEKKEEPAFAPRAYDLDCPACRSRLEFDSHTGDARVLKPGLTVPRNGPCPCGSHLKFKKCCGRKNEAPPV